MKYICLLKALIYLQLKDRIAYNVKRITHGSNAIRYTLYPIRF